MHVSGRAAAAARRLVDGSVLAAVLLAAVAALLAVPLQAQAQTEIEILETWPLVPAGIEVGDKFRLVFHSSDGHTALSTNINDYNTWIQDLAKAGHDHIQAFGDQFKAIASTAAVDARVNTKTRPSDTDAPIYWLNGNKAADNYADMYDGTWDEEQNRKDEDGIARLNVGSGTYVWSGSKDNGTEHTSDGISYALGTDNPRYGRFNHSGGSPFSLANNSVNVLDYPLLGLSPIFKVIAAPKIRFGSSSYHATEGGAERTVLVTMFPRTRTQVDIPVTVTNLGSTTGAGYQISVNGVLVSPGSLSVTFAAGENTKSFTVTAVIDSANDHRERVQFGFGTLPADVLSEGEADARAPKTTTVWLLGQQAESTACMTPDPSALHLDNNRYISDRRSGEIVNSGDCVWYKLPNFRNFRRHQIEYADRGVTTLSRITGPQLKLYNSNGTPLVQNGSAVEDQFVQGDRRFGLPNIVFTPATTGTYYVRVSSLGYDTGSFSIHYYDIGPGTAPATEAVPLTATLEDFPSNHDGSSAFTFRIAFSAEVEITPEDMRDHALTVTGGTVTNARRVDGRKDL